MSGNTASRCDAEGGGIYSGSSCTLTIYNSIVSQNYAGKDSNLYVYNTLSSDSSNNLINFDGGFIVAPEFDSDGKLKNADKMDLRLKAGSWAINRGNNDSVLSSITKDLAGNDRIFNKDSGGIVDIGAYEYQGDVTTDEMSLTITTNEDVSLRNDGKTSLREAIYFAQVGGEITFSDTLPSRTIELLAGELYVDKRITIDATSLAGGVTIDAKQKSRVFWIRGTTVIAVELKGLTITSGKTIGKYGGGIYAYSGSLMLTNCTVSGNTVAPSSDLSISIAGGGIYAYSSTLTLTNCEVSGNTLSNLSGSTHGGGIFADSDSTLTLTNCTVSGNTASGVSAEGGGINANGKLTLTNCTVSGNTITHSSRGYGANGGGIYAGSSSTLTLTNCTVSGNTASGFFSEGGGINANGKLTLTNCTVSGNTAIGFSSYGGGIDVSSSGTVTIYNSIVSQNDAKEFANIRTINSSVVGSNNLINFDGGFVVAPEFDSGGKLTNAGTMDLRLKAGSWAINGGSNELVPSDITKDMAGKDRIYNKNSGGIVDIGAYEYQGDVTTDEVSLTVTTNEDVSLRNDGKTSLREAIYFA